MKILLFLRIFIIALIILFSQASMERNTISDSLSDGIVSPDSSPLETGPSAAGVRTEYFRAANAVPPSLKDGLARGLYDYGIEKVTNVTSTKANGTYTTGTNIVIQVTFSTAVTIAGTLRLELSTGDPAITAIDYTGDTVTDTITFEYTVVAGNTSAWLDYAGTGSLSLISGTITDFRRAGCRPGLTCILRTRLFTC